MRRLSALAVLVVATMLAACATLPPARPVSDLRAIAGKWEGSLSGPGGSFPVTLVVKTDGTYEAETPTGPVTGTLQIVGSKIRFVNMFGQAGTWTLHEGDGKRVLKTVRDDGTGTGEFTPAK